MNIQHRQKGVFYDPEIHNLNSSQEGFLEFNIPTGRYIHLNAIGQGSYGVVSSALDLSTGKRVAIKKIGSMQSKVIALRTLREIRIMHFLNHENIIGINEIAQYNSYNEVYIIQPLIERDLQKAMTKDSFNDNATAYIMYQLFKGLKYLHAALIIHRDMKPSNILIDSYCNIKICDFGMARIYNDADENDDLGMTEYVATRWYRAPEVMIASRCYDKSIDVWSAGCILAELMSKSSNGVLFPGANYHQMLQLMIELLGSLTDEDIAYVKNPRAKMFLRQQFKATHVDWTRKYPSCCQESIDLLDKVMIFNPSERIKVEEALNHPFFKGFPQVPDYVFDGPLLFEENFTGLDSMSIKKLIRKRHKL